MTVVTNARAYYHTTRGCGRIGRPAFPAPSDLQMAGIVSQNSDASCRENAVVCLFTLFENRIGNGAHAIHVVLAKARTHTPWRMCGETLLEGFRATTTAWGYGSWPFARTTPFVLLRRATFLCRLDRALSSPSPRTFAGRGRGEGLYPRTVLLERAPHPPGFAALRRTTSPRKGGAR